MSGEATSSRHASCPFSVTEMPWVRLLPTPSLIGVARDSPVDASIVASVYEEGFAPNNAHSVNAAFRVQKV
jgi:hypothetical protein